MFNVRFTNYYIWYIIFLGATMYWVQLCTYIAINNLIQWNYCVLLYILKMPACNYSCDSIYNYMVDPSLTPTLIPIPPHLSLTLPVSHLNCS